MSIKGFSVGGNVERYDYNSLDNLPSEITIDTALSDSSTNPVQNRVVTSAINSANGFISSISGDVDDLKSAVAQKSEGYIASASGTTVEVITDKTQAKPLRGIYIYGKSVQDGAPSPTNAVAIVGYGTLENGSYYVNISAKDDGVETIVRIGGMSSPLYDGDIIDLFHEKVYRYNKILTYNGSENWSYNSGSSTPTNLCMVITSSLPADYGYRPMLCNRFVNNLTTNMQGATGDQYIGQFGGHIQDAYSNYLYFRVPASILSAASAAAWKTWLASNNVIVVAKLKTPTEETVTVSADVSGMNGLVQVSCDTAVTVSYAKSITDTLNALMPTVQPSTFANEWFYSMFVQKGLSSANYHYAYSANRCSTVTPIRANKPLQIKAKTGFDFAVYSWTDYQPDTATLMANSGWISADFTIAENVLFSVTVRKHDNSNISVSEVKDAIEIETAQFADNTGSFTLCFNHRGYMAGAPENTLAAFRYSKRFGFNAIETDVHKTADGRYVLIHDATINRTSNGTGNVNSYTLAELKTFDFGSWYNPSWAGTRIPTLEEGLDLCRNLGLKVFLELKDTANFEEADIANIISIVKARGMFDNTYYLSLTINNLLWVNKYAPNCYLLRPVPNTLSQQFVTDTLAVKTHTNCVGIAIYAQYLDSAAIALCKENDLIIHTQANTIAELRNFADDVSCFSSDTFPVQKELPRIAVLS